MWPVKKKTVTTPKTASAEAMSYSQLDITENFDDNLGLTPDEWIPTLPLNKTTRSGWAMGLPPARASEEEIYRLPQSCRRSESQYRFQTTAYIARFVILPTLSWRSYALPVRSVGERY